MKLGELIRTRQDDLGLSLNKLAAKARDGGYDLTTTTLSAFARHDLAESPKRRTMEAIACALEVSYSEVVMAVAQSMADDPALVEVTNTQHVRSWLTLTDGRTDAEVGNLLRVVRSVTEALDAAQTQEGGASAPGSSDETGT